MEHTILTIKPIGHIRTGFKTKFGVPRQSGLVQGLRGTIVFEPEFRNPDALRGLEDFTHIWLLWDFSKAHTEGKWSPTVRPPRLGGNKRMGVWATRSPFRPNSIGLSSVRIVGIYTNTAEGPVIEVEGIDMMDGTPIIDIKPYLPFTDIHADARGGFAEMANETSHNLNTTFDEKVRDMLSEKEMADLRGIISQDPRPHYQDDEERIYAMEYDGMEVKFRIKEDNAYVISARRQHGK